MPWSWVAHSQLCAREAAASHSMTEFFQEWRGFINGFRHTFVNFRLFQVKKLEEMMSSAIGPSMEGIPNMPAYLQSEFCTRQPEMTQWQVLKIWMRIVIMAWIIVVWWMVFQVQGLEAVECSNYPEHNKVFMRHYMSSCAWRIAPFQNCNCQSVS